jgi:multiple sugar transport system permease protein
VQPEVAIGPASTPDGQHGVQFARGAVSFGTRAGGGRRRRIVRIATIVGSCVIVALSYFPFAIIASNSLKSPSELTRSGPFELFSGFTPHNYVLAANGMAPYLWNTVIVAAAAIVLGVPSAALAAYGFAQSRFWGKEILFYVYLGLLLIPWTLTLIPLFIEVQHFGLFNTWGALIFPYAASAQPLLLFLDRAFFEGIPSELFQSARVDGASELQVLRKVVVPLSRPILLTGVVLMAISAWGDYLWPTIVLTATNRFTVSAGLQAFVGTFGISGKGQGAVFAAYVLAILPLFALVAVTMRYFVGGVTSGVGKL